VLKRLMIYLSDIVHLKLLGGSKIKKEHIDRTQKFILKITKILPQDHPYVIEGKWKWCMTNDGIMPSLTLVYPQLGFVCVYWGPEVGDWKTSRQFCKNKSAWELANRIASTVEVKCKEFGFHYLSVKWGDPVDEESLKLKLSELLDT